MLISIITPTYNRKERLRQMIDSVLEQTFSNWELIIVDDGSTDGTAEMMAAEYKHANITYLPQASNHGPATCRNIGFAASKGEYIVFLDSDDFAYPPWIERATASIKPTTGIYCCGSVRATSDGKKTKQELWVVRMANNKVPISYTCGSLFIERTLFMEVGGCDATLQSNMLTDLIFRILIRMSERPELTIETLPNEYLMQINVHTGDRIRTNWQRIITGSEQFLRKHYALLKQYDPREISNICITIANACYKLHNRKGAIKYTVKAIGSKPMRVVNYLRLVKYSFF